MENVFDILNERGYLDQCTYEDELREMLGKEPVTFYVGFDATADSLTLGHFIQIRVMQHMQNAGHIPIALLGGGTTTIGDPSGKSDMRTLMDRDTINYNATRFKEQISNFLDFSEDKGYIENNADWLMKLTFFEFSYMLMQSYDFLYLYRKHYCKLEVGGSDQWSNILGGYELVRKLENDKVYAMTFKLLTTASGIKMGKTMAGAIWLDPEKTTPYEMFQYLRNCDDRDVIKFMKLLTMLPLDKIAEYEKLEGAELNTAKEVLAYEVVKDIHGEESAKSALSASRSLFGGDKNSEDIPSTEMSSDKFNAPVGILNLMSELGLIKTNSEGRRLINQGGVSIDDKKINDPKLELTKDDFKDGEIIIRKGKKVYHKVILKWG